MDKKEVTLEDVDEAMKESESSAKMAEEPSRGRPAETKSAPVAMVEPKKTINDYAMTETTGVMNPIEYAQVMLVSSNLIAGRAIPQGFQTKEQVFMAIMAGKEMGMGMIESLNSLYFVNGKINLYGAGLVARFRAAGWDIEYEDESDTKCTAVVSRTTKQGTEEVKATFLFEDAEKSGYTKARDGKLKFGWYLGMNRKLKLRYGALNLVAKTYLPEVMGAVRGIVEIEEDATPNGIINVPQDDHPATSNQIEMIKKLNPDADLEGTQMTKSEAAVMISELSAGGKNGK